MCRTGSVCGEHKNNWLIKEVTKWAPKIEKLPGFPRQKWVEMGYRKERYQLLKAEKKLRAVVRGLHPYTKICEIKRNPSDSDYSTKNCQKSKNQNENVQIYCAEAHTASWKGCSAYNKAEEKVRLKKVTIVIKVIQQKPVKTATSYAQITLIL
ncbi:Hypothetical protein CINCED_3A018657 [Cinara cedri]|uniref:Uncharacterized protein n=1 Tax=Cinara cedri TaxID=506608 RepID=A0A5E4N6H9_9HEMI|nr:Hypothetical protein CINCED_3A018657 [Cinara cedri]